MIVISLGITQNPFSIDPLSVSRSLYDSAKCLYYPKGTGLTAENNL